MKKSLPIFLITFLWAFTGWSQDEPAPNQNPDYALSRARYMGVADSLTALHGTTLQETYKAIDWLADRREARAARRSFRQQLRLSRAQWYSQSYYPSYRYGTGRYHRSYRSHWFNPWRGW